MSRKVCRRDQYKLNQILEQVEALSDVVDELRAELNHLKKISLNVNRENICFESIKENHNIDYTSPNILQKVKAYFENIGFPAKVDETYKLTKNSQVRKECQEPIRFSTHTIYDSLKYLKNKVVKNVRNVRKTQQSAKSTKNMCVTSNQEQQQREACLLRKKEEQKTFKFNKRNENTYTDISEELDNLADTLCTSNASAQADITICLQQENDKKSHNCKRLGSRNVAENNEQISPLSIINDERPAIHSHRFADELSKNYVRQTFLKSKIKKYKRCSCREQCPYALYKLPCDKYRCSTPEKKVDDEISGLTLECLSFGEKKDFPKFINVDTVRNSGCFADSSPVEIGNESLTSSLSVDLEVDVCSDYCDLAGVDEFTKRRKARTYIVNRTSMKKDDLIQDFRAEIEPSFNITSSWKNICEEKEKIDEIVKKILSGKRCTYSEENNQEYKTFGTGNFISNHWSMENNNKQIQCFIPELTTPVFNKKISVKTSTSNFQQTNSQLYRTIDETRCKFPKMIIPTMKTTEQAQADKRSYLNCIRNGSPALGDYTNERNAKEINIKDERKTRKNNTCDICAIDMDASSSEIIWPRMKKYNIYSTLRTTREEANGRSNKPLSQTCDSAAWQNKIMPVRTSCLYCCNRVSGKKLKNCMASSTHYYPAYKGLNFDISKVSGKLYNCLEKSDDMTA